MRRRIFAWLLALFVMPSLSGCAVSDALEVETATGGDKPVIVATVFPAYDFARVLTKGEAQVRLLLPPGSESHSYEPTPQDIIAIQNADLFLTVGGESEHWIKGILDSMGENAPRTLALMDCVTGLEEEWSRSMQQEDAHSEEESPELDEHVWTSPKNAQRIVKRLAAVLSEVWPSQAAAYDRAALEYLAQLNELDLAFQETTLHAARKKIIFGDRFPFRYFAHEYGLDYDAAFPGCSEDSEPSARTLVSLIREIKSEQIPVIFYIEFSSRKTADILAEETGAKPILLHSCHNVSAEELTSGATYLSLMWGNVAALREALN